MLEFRVNVPFDPDGYEWVGERQVHPIFGSDANDPGPWLLGLNYKRLRDQLATEGGSSSQAYDPFEQEPALFRIFASLKPTESEILEFANQYGDIEDVMSMTLGGASTPAKWAKAIEQIREQVEFADKHFPPKPRRQRLQERTEAFKFIAGLLKHMAVKLGIDEHSGQISLSACSSGLFDAMKLQLAVAVLEGKSYRNCDYCEKPFELSAKQNRNDRVFCSPNCRVKAYLKRRRQTVSMRSKGKSLREIAKATKSDMATVRKWLEAAEKDETKET